MYSTVTGRARCAALLRMYVVPQTCCMWLVQVHLAYAGVVLTPSKDEFHSLLQ
jgi:hypothetical protein